MQIVAPPKTLNIQLAKAGAKKAAGRWNAIPPTSVKTAPTGLHGFDFDGMRQANGGHLKHLESISCSCLHGERDKLTQTQLLAMQSFKTSLDQMGLFGHWVHSGQDSTDKLDVVIYTHLCQLT